jgi:glutamate synthase domain-containing protein 3
MEVIKTKTLQMVIEKRERILELKSKMDVLKAEAQTIKEELDRQEQRITEAIERGAPVVSNLFSVALKEHLLQNRVNWQQQFHNIFPSEYEKIQRDAGKRIEMELVIARKET